MSKRFNHEGDLGKFHFKCSGQLVYADDELVDVVLQSFALMDSKTRKPVVYTASQIERVKKLVLDHFGT